MRLILEFAGEFVEDQTGFGIIQIRHSYSQTRITQQLERSASQPVRPCLKRAGVPGESSYNSAEGDGAQANFDLDAFALPTSPANAETDDSRVHNLSGPTGVHRKRRAVVMASVKLASSCRIPPELADRIIDYLHDDTASLKTCSLTCLSWVPSSQYHLFSTVKLISPEDYVAFALLLALSPRLGQYVETMVLETYPEVPEGTLLGDIAAHLGRVTRLFLTGADVPINAHTFAQLGPVAELTIGGPFARLADVAALFTAFPRVRDLAVMTLRCSEKGPHALPALPLRRLRLHRSCSAVLPVLVREPAPEMEDLTTYMPAADEYVDFCDFLRRVGPSLRMLELQMNCHARNEYAALADSFAACEELRVVRFTTYPAVAWVITLLGRLASAHVEELTFNVHNIINGKVSSSVFAR
ncbi:hypothetical protein CERSUDRAFT_126564 [Gelatoporia subvermispora B]|uniref:F-box domain-containing protein n=1 Tax=Ceriporiopsis subvermispora (strain B) TaxID=914234 RepID=M2R3D4_CERS8|nr:hypothetical protein CERSUDRAFT_126564 [Gelatoporia subvermispora B]